MKIIKGVQLFFGCKIDSKLRDALAQARPGDRRYFEDPNSEFLRVCQVGEERWIGKVMNGGVAVTDVEDIQRNIVSILRRIAPNVRTPVSALKIFALEAEGQVVESEPVGGAQDEEPPPAAGGGGPYIDY